MARFLGAGEEREEFFDSREVLSPASVASSPSSSGRHDDGGWLFAQQLLEVWVRDPGSVHERRQRFVKSLGLLDPSPYAARPGEETCSKPEASEEILPASPSAELFSAAPTFAGRGGEPTASGDDGAATEEKLECVFKNLDDGTVFVVDEMGKDGSFRSLRERRSNRTVTATEFEQTFGSSPFIRELMRRVDDSDEPSTPEKTVMRRRRRRRRLGWLRRLGIGVCVVDADAEEDDEVNSTSSASSRGCSRKVDRVKVRPYKKRSKELSAVYKGQVIKAHEGAIVTMKFSSDGQFLATGGEDGVVRVWRVVEGKRPDDRDFIEDDPSCVFFTVNENSELAPINSCEGGKGKHSKSSKGATDPACVVIPHRTFALSEDPVHEFRGHHDVILDLSWSKNRVS
jgi:acylphosphatase